jgi:hypothetical protein
MVTTTAWRRRPERIVHARGPGAHGYFEAYDAFTRYTCAAPFAEKGKITPVFVRFSTVAGERGSKDTARDVRGFAVHGKTILALGAGRELLEMAGIGPTMDEAPGILVAEGADAAETASAFIDAIAAHRHPSRESDPPTK